MSLSIFQWKCPLNKEGIDPNISFFLKKIDIEDADTFPYPK